jgi:hypothetical protein
MSLLKSEAKLSAVNEIGNRLDDALENATKDLYREEGAVSALRNAAVSVENFIKVVHKDLDEKEEDLETSKKIKSYLERVRNNIVGLANVAENNKQSQAGKLGAFQHAVSIAKKYRDEEINRQQILRRALERSIEEEGQEKELNGPESPGRVVGTRPGPSIKLKRLSEEKNNIDTSGQSSVEPQKEKTEETQIKDQAEAVSQTTKTKLKKQKK